MRKTLLLMVCLLLAISLSGCVKTYTYQVERKDQDLVGNRGIIKGEVPPPVTGRKRMRTMGGMDIELPPTEEYLAKKEALEGGVAPAEKEVKKKIAKKKALAKVEVEEELITEEPEAPGEAVAKLELPEEKTKGFADEQWVKKEEVVEERKAPSPVRMEYTVKKGDTLGKIAKECLGDSSKWIAIYEVNKDIIKDPSRIYPGQVLVIPQIEPEKEEAVEAYK